MGLAAFAGQLFSLTCHHRSESSERGHDGVALFRREFRSLRDDPGYVIVETSIFEILPSGDEIGVVRVAGPSE
jgi:hypothetical protein